MLMMYGTWAVLIFITFATLERLFKTKFIIKQFISHEK